MLQLCWTSWSPGSAPLVSVVLQAQFTPFLPPDASLKAFFGQIYAGGHHLRGLVQCLSDSWATSLKHKLRLLPILKTKFLLLPIPGLWPTIQS